MEQNLNSIDVESQVISSDSYLNLDLDNQITYTERAFSDQYINFVDLGNNLMKDSDTYAIMLSDEARMCVFKPMIEYVSANYVSIGDEDNINGSPTRLNIAGEYIYTFICVDNVNAILPAYIDVINVVDIEGFDDVFNNKYLNDYGAFREDYLSVIQATITQLIKLQKLDESVKKDVNYQKLLAQYYYYQEIIDYGDMEMFLTQYIRPVLNKYFSTLLWRRM